jgi:uncharacterized damage-inducible protein DinB
MKTLFIAQALANRWANQLLYAEICKLSPEQLTQASAVNYGSMLGIANHVILGDRLWLYRFTGQGEPLRSVSGIVYPEFAELHVAREELDERIIDFAQGLAEARLAEILNYTTTSGQDKSQPLALCVAHFFNHQTHHRGQLHGMLGVLGVSAPDIDLLYFPGAQALWSA